MMSDSTSTGTAIMMGRKSCSSANMIRPQMGYSLPQATATSTTTGSTSSLTTMITPTSTPPIRMIAECKDQLLKRYSSQNGSSDKSHAISPSPVTTRMQEKYYEDATWRMYSRIQLSRQVQQQEAAAQQRGCLSSVPRFVHNYYPSSSSRTRAEDLPDDSYDRHHESEDDMIFDLEM